MDPFKFIVESDDVVYRDPIADIYRVRLKNHPGLILAEFAALDMVGIVCHADLQFVIQTARHTDALLVAKSLQQPFI